MNILLDLYASYCKRIFDSDGNSLPGLKAGDYFATGILPPPNLFYEDDLSAHKSWIRNPFRNSAQALKLEEVPCPGGHHASSLLYGEHGMYTHWEWSKEPASNFPKIMTEAASGRKVGHAVYMCCPSAEQFSTFTLSVYPKLMMWEILSMHREDYPSVVVSCGQPIEQIDICLKYHALANSATFLPGAFHVNAQLAFSGGQSSALSKPLSRIRPYRTTISLWTPPRAEQSDSHQTLEISRYSNPFGAWCLSRIDSTVSTLICLFEPRFTLD